MRCTEESPRPIPRTARPPLSAWRASAAEAVTAGSRVTELVTPGPRWTRMVACAVSISWPQTSGARFWLSGKRKVSKPSSSRRRAVRADRRGSGTARTPNSILGGCRSNHAGCGERSGGCERGARSSLLRRATRHASSVVAALPALAPRLVRLARHGYSDRLLAEPYADPRGGDPALQAAPRRVAAGRPGR